MENEEEEDEIFTTLQGEDEEEKEEEEPEAERKSSWDVPIPSRSVASRRASLPCPAQLNAMHLSRLLSATVATSPAHLSHLPQSGEAKPCSRFSHVGNNGTQTKGSTCERRPHAIPTIPEVHEPLERKARFRSRNVMSLSDADSLCLICHDNLRKGGGGIRELHCSHSFHSECIEEWLWSNQTCPTCQKHVAMPEPLYWRSTRVIVP
ncbi:E3 ubiquitin-protein ligase CIP8 [Pimephales promelas]|uniref:E3 ubiquitin-protein ligase CIP8 n=1 Tax=Pimephales promelas TaxID=90988 RepID=UPI001955ECEC|nr:E3 ubiquitin-protein ligase CIP8 [Pimephales promelas]KAG1942481.1 E3 ubiquitin-protein ligase DZIP3 [Pimephales promelas]